MRITPKFKFKVSKGPPEMRGYTKAARGMGRQLTKAYKGFAFTLPGRTSRGPSTTYGGPQKVEYPVETVPRSQLPSPTTQSPTRRGRKPGSKNKPKPAPREEDMGGGWRKRATDIWNDPLTQELWQEAKKAAQKLARRKAEDILRNRKRQGNYKTTTEGNDSNKATFSKVRYGRYRRLHYGDFKLNEKLVTTRRMVSALGKQILSEYALTTRDDMATAAAGWLPAIQSQSTISTTSIPYALDRSAGFYLRSIKLKIQIASSSNVLNTIKIQFFMPKQDNDQSALQTFTNNVTMDAYGTNPTNYVAPSVYNIGNSTSKYPGFNRLWKTVSSNTIALSPGEIHTCYATFHLNKLLTKTDYDGVNRTASYLSYTTPTVLFTLSGSIVHDKTNIGTSEGSTDNDSINISQAAVDIVFTREIKFSYKPNAKFSMIRDRMDSVFTGPVATVDEDGAETTAIA